MAERKAEEESSEEYESSEEEEVEDKGPAGPAGAGVKEERKSPPAIRLPLK